MKVRKLYEQNGNSLEFFPTGKKDLPYRIVINGVAIDFMKYDWHPSVKNAKFYFDKHKNNIPDPPAITARC